MVRIAVTLAVAAPLSVAETVVEGEPVVTSVELALNVMLLRGETEEEEEADTAPLGDREGAAEAV